MTKFNLPDHISDEMRDFASKLVDLYEFKDAQLKMLQQACEAWDRSQEAAQILDEEGLTMRDRFGQEKARPENQIEQSNRSQFYTIMRMLGINEVEIKKSTSSAAPTRRR